MLPSQPTSVYLSEGAKELVGYYKYKAGEKFTDKNGKEVAGKKDDFAIYAVFFTTDKGDWLSWRNKLADKWEHRHEGWTQQP